MSESHKSTALTIPLCAPALPGLDVEVSRRLQNFDGMEIVRGQVPGAVVRAAQDYLTALDPFLTPPSDLQIELWLRKLRSGVAPISESEFGGRLEATRFACGSIPGWVWNMETLRDALCSFKFFPSTKEISDLLSNVALKAMKGISIVQMLAAARPADVVST